MSRTMSGITASSSSGGDGDVTQAGTNVFTGTNTYNTNRPTSTIGGGVGLSGDDFITKDDFDTLTSVSDVTQSGTNVFTGTNTYNTNRPTSTIGGGVGLSGDDFITKDDFDTLTSVSDVTQAGTNVFTGTNQYNTNRPTSSLTYPSSPAGDSDFITKADLNNDLKDGMIIQVAQTYFRGIFFNGTGSSNTYVAVPDLKVGFIRKSVNSHFRVSFLVHYSSDGGQNAWFLNSVRLDNVNGLVVGNSTSSSRSFNEAGMSCANTYTGGVLQCLPISGCFIDENPVFNGDGRIEYTVTVKPAAAGNVSQQNPFCINTIYQANTGRPAYCSYIMLEEIFKKS